MSSLDRRLSQVLFRRLSAAYLLRFGMISLRSGCLCTRAVHYSAKRCVSYPRSLEETSVQKMVAKWRRFFRRVVVVSSTIERLTDRPSRGLYEDAKKETFEFLRKPHFYWSGRLDLNQRPLAPQAEMGPSHRLSESIKPA